jgi:hypothetical protein
LQLLVIFHGSSPVKQLRLVPVREVKRCVTAMLVVVWRFTAALLEVCGDLRYEDGDGSDSSRCRKAEEASADGDLIGATQAAPMDESENWVTVADPHLIEVDGVTAVKAGDVDIQVVQRRRSILRD